MFVGTRTGHCPASSWSIRAQISPEEPHRGSMWLRLSPSESPQVTPAPPLFTDRIPPALLTLAWGFWERLSLQALRKGLETPRCGNHLGRGVCTRKQKPRTGQAPRNTETRSRGHSLCVHPSLAHSLHRSTICLGYFQPGSLMSTTVLHLFV